MLCFITDNKQNDICGDYLHLDEAYAAIVILGHFAALEFDGFYILFLESTQSTQPIRATGHMALRLL